MRGLNQRSLFITALVVSLLGGTYHFVRQAQEGAYVAAVTAKVLADAHASTQREKVIAIRDYLRTHVTYESAPFYDKDRPFLRASAAETLQLGKGYCGEVSRTFICMARTANVDAQRVNLFGDVHHTVAEARIDGIDLIVDPFSAPMYRVDDMRPVEEIVSRPPYRDYSTLNLRRLHLEWLFSRTKLALGPITYWSENPHALQGLAFLSVGVMLLLLAVARRTLRAVLHHRGWLHASELPPEQRENIRARRAGSRVVA